MGFRKGKKCLVLRKAIVADATLSSMAVNKRAVPLSALAAIFLQEGKHPSQHESLKSFMMPCCGDEMPLWTQMTSAEKFLLSISPLTWLPCLLFHTVLPSQPGTITTHCLDWLSLRSSFAKKGGCQSVAILRYHLWLNG